MPNIRPVKKSQTILYQGEAPSHTFSVISGLVRAYSILENGEEANVAFYGPGDYFPAAPAFGLVPVSLFYYETVVDTELRPMGNSEFMDMLAADYEEELYNATARHTGALLHVNALLQHNAQHKIAHILRYLSVRFGAPLLDKKRVKITIRLTQSDLAKLCGLSRETASIELGKLRDAGVYSEDKKFYVIDTKQLQDVIGDNSPITTQF